MNIWLVELNLVISDDCFNYDLIFKCTKEEGFTKTDEGFTYLSPYNWNRRVIPSEITISKLSGGYNVILGLENEPNEDELKVIKGEMKAQLHEYIENELENYLSEGKRKLSKLGE